MIKILTTLLALISFLSTANASDADHHSHEGHIHEKMIDGKKLAVDPDRFDKFLVGLEDAQVAIVNVQGMVCDFCAQAIQKVFLKKEEVAGITVDLDNQNVVISLKEDTNITDNVIEDLFINAGYNVSEINREKL